MIEEVNDCGPLPKPNPKCKISNTNDRELEFPNCCPKFTCEEGAVLEWATKEEIEELRRQQQAGAGPGAVNTQKQAA